MFRKVALLSIAWYALAVVVSGCCNCPPNPSRRFRWTSMHLNTYGYAINSGSVYINDSVSDFVSQNPAIELRMNYELIAGNRRESPGIIGCAYACKCDIDPRFIPASRIAGLNIYSLRDYDSAHPAMSDVTSYFREPRYSNDSGTVMSALALPGTAEVINNAALNYFVYLVTRPSIGKEHQFRVLVRLEDGTEISDTTALLQF